MHYDYKSLNITASQLSGALCLNFLCLVLSCQPTVRRPSSSVDWSLFHPSPASASGPAEAPTLTGWALSPSPGTSLTDEQLYRELKNLLGPDWISASLSSCAAAGLMLAVVVVSRWCLWLGVDACTTAPSSMNCSTLWASTTNRPALTGTTTSKFCCKTFSQVRKCFTAHKCMHVSPKFHEVMEWTPPHRNGAQL